MQTLHDARPLKTPFASNGRLRLLGLVLALWAALASHAAADHVTVLCSNGYRAVLVDLLPRFERTSGHTISVTYGLSAELARRIEAGETFDVAILTPALIDTLAARGRIAAGSAVTLARSPIGLTSRSGAAKPDLQTTAALRQTLLSAKSVAYAREGASAAFFLAIIQALGLTDALSSRVVAAPSGAAVGAAVADGTAELGIIPISEILPIPGIEVAGAFPPPMAGFITMTAGMGARGAAARALVTFLASPDVEPVLETHGMQPGR
jgi:molybdate transport system substrate-binding protein